MDTKVVGELAHEVNFETVTKFFLKPGFGSIVSSPVTAIINIRTKINSATTGRGSHEKARVVGTDLTPNVLENGAKSLVPMSGAPAKAIQCLLKAPVSTGFGIRAAFGRANDADLVLWKVRVAESVLGITLFHNTTLRDSICHHGLNAVFHNNRGK
jgi:hypothetical protein